MSLRTVHIFFISASILLAFLFAEWNWRRSGEGTLTSSVLWAVSSALLGIGLVVYLVIFVRKTRKLSSS